MSELGQTLPNTFENSTTAIAGIEDMEFVSPILPKIVIVLL